MVTILNNRVLQTEESIPHIIKYMGSKRQIIDYVIEGINDYYTDGTIKCY